MELTSAREPARDRLGTDPCPVARAVSVIGDRWTLLIIRDCFLGKSRFGELHASLGVTRHLLAERLRRLVAMGVLKKNPYSLKPPRYDYLLTDKGRDLAPALVGLRDWGRKYLPVRKPSRS